MDIITNILLGIGLYLLGCVLVLVLCGINMLWDRFVEHIDFEISTIEICIFAGFSWIAVVIFSFIFLFYAVCYLSYKFCLKYVFGWFKQISEWFKNLNIWDKHIVWDKYGLRITY